MRTSVAPTVARSAGVRRWDGEDRASAGPLRVADGVNPGHPPNVWWRTIDGARRTEYDGGDVEGPLARRRRAGSTVLVLAAMVTAAVELARDHGAGSTPPGSCFFTEIQSNLIGVAASRGSSRTALGQNLVPSSPSAAPRAVYLDGHVLGGGSFLLSDVDVQSATRHGRRLASARRPGAYVVLDWMVDPPTIRAHGARRTRLASSYPLAAWAGLTLVRGAVTAGTRIRSLIRRTVATGRWP